MVSVAYKRVLNIQGDTDVFDGTEKHPDDVASMISIVLPKTENYLLAAQDIITAYLRIGGKHLRLNVDGIRAFVPTSEYDRHDTLVPASFGNVLMKLTSIPIAHDIPSGASFKFTLDNSDDTLAMYMGSAINSQIDAYDIVPSSWYVKLLPNELYNISATVVPYVCWDESNYWDDADQYGANAHNPLITPEYDSGRPANTPSGYININEKDVYVVDLMFVSTYFLPGARDELRYNFSKTSRTGIIHDKELDAILDAL